MKKTWLVVLLFFLLAVGFWIYWWFIGSEKWQESTYIQDRNQYMQQLKVARQTAQQQVEPLKDKIARDAMYTLAEKVSEGMSGDIELYGRVIDQNGNPVVGARIDYGASGYLYAKGSGGASEMTDENGFFAIRNAKGASLAIYKINKEGYEVRIQDNYLDFKGMDEGYHNLVWSDYTKDKPYLFKAWKADKYAKVNTGRDVLGFESDGRVYKLDLSKSPIDYGSMIQSGDMTVSFLVYDKAWKVKIGAIDGGLQESNDEYMNLAPEYGYQPEIVYSGTDNIKANFKRKYYFKSRGGKLYGAVALEVRPYGSDVRITYTVNLEGGRELAVRPKE